MNQIDDQRDVRRSACPLCGQHGGDGSVCAECLEGSAEKWEQDERESEQGWGW